MPTRSIFTFPFIAMLAYSIVSLVLLWHHEPWRDEMQCWEIARQSSSLSELFHNARYEGHPSGWYVLLFAITRLTPDFTAVQGFHWALALASVALVLWRSPFGRWQKGLLVFGYFFLFEYGVLTRNYAIGVLLALAICCLAQDWRRHWLAMHLLLFCLMQCSLFAALLSMAFFVPLFFMGVKGRNPTAISWQKLALGALLFTAGLLLSASDMAPPADTNYASAWKWASPDCKPALGAFFRAMVPVPPWDLHGWGSHFLDKLLDIDKRVVVQCWGSVVLLFCCIWSLRKSPFALAFFGLAWTGISVFLAVKFLGYSRHHGHFYLAWVIAFWVKQAAVTPFEKVSLIKPDKLANAFFTFILVVQFVSVLPLAYFDLKYPFSQSKFAADFLRKNHLTDRFIVGDYDYATSAVAFHLRRPIYFPNRFKSATYLLWNSDQDALKYNDIVPVAMGLCQQHGEPDVSGKSLMLLTSYPIPSENLNDSIRVIQAFVQAMEWSEEYYLYEVRCGGE